MPPNLIGPNCNALEQNNNHLRVDSLLVNGNCESCTSAPGGPSHCETIPLQADWLMVTKVTNQQRISTEMDVISSTFMQSIMVSTESICATGFMFDGELLVGHLYAVHLKHGHGGNAPLLFVIGDETVGINRFAAMAVLLVVIFVI